LADRTPDRSPDRTPDRSPDRSPDRTSDRTPELRPATGADREFLYRVYASTRADELAVVAWPAAVVETFLHQQFDAQDRHYRQHFPTARFWVIVVDGQRAGRLYEDLRSEETLIIDIALLPEYRGRGVGTRLVGAVLAAARARGVGVSIHVERNNPALAWYRRLGFEVVEDEGVYLLLRWRPPNDAL
jgi:ribosomal protein S18 acetylase RimI-like enzyme